MMRRVIRLAAAATAVMLLTSGCTLFDRAGAAAVIDGQRISESMLAAEAASMQAALVGQSATITPAEMARTILAIHVQDAVIRAAAAREGLTIDAATVKKLHDELKQQVGGTEEQLAVFAASQGVPPTMVDTVLGLSVLMTDLGAKLAPEGDDNAQGQAAVQYLSQLAAEMAIEIAPRFGAWDPSQFTVGQPVNDLSLPIELLQG